VDRRNSGRHQNLTIITQLYPLNHWQIKRATHYPKPQTSTIRHRTAAAPVVRCRAHRRTDLDILSARQSAILTNDPRPRSHSAAVNWSASASSAMYWKSAPFRIYRHFPCIFAPHSLYTSVCLYLFCKDTLA